MRYFAIFGSTLIIIILIFYFNPKCLGKYENEAFIDLESIDENYKWKYELDNNNISIIPYEKNKWKIIPKKNGNVQIIFYYTDSNINNYKYKIRYNLKIRNKKIYWIDGQGYGLLDFPNIY